jgi:hypothetical protein
MKQMKTMLGLVVAGLCLAGCQTSPPKGAYTPVVVEKKAKKAEQPQPTHHVRKRTPEQMQMLQDFALKESPKIWQTLQDMRGEMTESGAKLKALRADLLEFDRDPDTDEDYKSLVVGLKELKRAYDAIFDRLESAYIAAKKYEASPSRKDYQDVMKRALEDGIQDATMATERYKAMTRKK